MKKTYRKKQLTRDDVILLVCASIILTPITKEERKKYYEKYCIRIGNERFYFIIESEEFNGNK